MIVYLKAILLLGSLAMAGQTILFRGNEELGILYLILFTAFRELWEIDNGKRCGHRTCRKNRKKIAKHKKRRATKTGFTKEIGYSA